MTAVAVREGVNRHQSMVKSDGDFVGLICLVLNPGPGIVQQDGEIGRDAIGCGADVALGLAIGAGPASHIAEHSPMQRAHEAFIEKAGGRQTTLAASPGSTLQDVLLFGLVEIAAMRDPGLP